MQSNHEETLTHSLQRCLERETFIADFYRFFIDSSKEIEHLFRHSDLVAQRDMMAKSLMSMISASDENWLNDQYLARLSKRHSEIGIKPEHFALWESALLESVKQHDPLFDEAILSAWMQVIKRGKAFMLGSDQI